MSKQPYFDLLIAQLTIMSLVGVFTRSVHCTLERSILHVLYSLYIAKYKTGWVRKSCYKGRKFFRGLKIRFIFFNIIFLDFVSSTIVILSDPSISRVKKKERIFVKYEQNGRIYNFIFFDYFPNYPTFMLVNRFNQEWTT